MSPISARRGREVGGGTSKRLCQPKRLSFPGLKKNTAFRPTYFALSERWNMAFKRGISLLKQNTRFRECYTHVLGVQLNRRKYVFWLFYNIGLCSATSMESSRRDLLNVMAEHRSIFKNSQNTHNSFIFLDRPMFSHINGKLSLRPFKWYGWTLVYLEK